MLPTTQCSHHTPTLESIQDFFDQVGHQTTNASIRNKYFFTNIFIVRLTYQDYEQSRQKLSTPILDTEK